jgi:hypothetical protein
MGMAVVGDVTQVLFVSTASTDFLGQHSSAFFTKTVVNAQQLLLQVLALMAPFHDDGASTSAPAAPHASHKRYDTARHGTARHDTTHDPPRSCRLAGDNNVAGGRLPGVCAMELARVCVELESWGVAHIQGIVQQLSALVAHHHQQQQQLHGETPVRTAPLSI